MIEFDDPQLDSLSQQLRERLKRGLTEPAEKNYFGSVMAQWSKRPDTRILELGTKRSISDRPTTSKANFPLAAEYLGLDIEAGPDVDVVCDATEMSSVLGRERFDLVISRSTFEHIHTPWVAASEIAKVLKPGGEVLLQTHHAFPVHAYPNDYWRMTTDGLERLFSPEIGFETIQSWFRFPGLVVAPTAKPAVRQSQVFLNISIHARRLPGAELREWRLLPADGEKR